jgi:uncharacterized protein YndB with AHSA1/START domain
MDATAQAIEFEVRRVLHATPAQVFAAWTQADSLGQWFAPTSQMTTIVHQLDARLGGSYRIEMRAADGTPHVTRGKYTHFEEPNRLAFTWCWEGKEDEESLVDIELRPTDVGCELVLRHSRFATAKSRDGHMQGWEGCLVRLSAIFFSNY